MNDRLVVIREGHGEAGAVENLVVRAAQALGLYGNPFLSLPESPRYAFASPEGAVRAARIAATQKPDAALLTADLDDACPALTAPQFADAIVQESFNFPIAVVLFHREFETLAISVAPSLAGKDLKSTTGKTILTLNSAPAILTNPESRRDAKGWISTELMDGVPYKPTVHQLPLTRAMDIEDLQQANLSSYRRLENALKFLADSIRSGTNGVYPKSAT